MKSLLALFILALTPLFAAAHQPLLVNPSDPNVYIEITDPEISFAYYGELVGYPHTYEFSLMSTTTLYTQILEPDIESAQQNHSGIIVRAARRGVDEVARLPFSDARWDRMFEPFGGDHYRQGAVFEQTVPAGDYLIEVSNADNLGKYVLVVGKVEDFGDLGYFATLKRIYEVKRFFEKPAIAVLQSPFYYVPTSIFLLIGGGLWFWYHRRRLSKHG